MRSASGGSTGGSPGGVRRSTSKGGSTVRTDSVLRVAVAPRLVRRHFRVDDDTVDVEQECADHLEAGEEAGASGASALRPSFDGHQFQRPSRRAVEGTSNVRTRNVSISTPSAIAQPTWRSWLVAPRTPLTANVPARITPADVIVVPVRCSARWIAWPSESLCASSRIRAIIRML